MSGFEHARATVASSSVHPSSGLGGISPVRKTYSLPRDSHISLFGRLCSLSKAAKSLFSIRFWVLVARVTSEAKSRGHFSREIKRTITRADSGGLFMLMIVPAVCAPLTTLAPLHSNTPLALLLPPYGCLSS